MWIIDTIYVKAMYLKTKETNLYLGATALRYKEQLILWYRKDTTQQPMDMLEEQHLGERGTDFFCCFKGLNAHSIHHLI